MEEKMEEQTELTKKLYKLYIIYKNKNLKDEILKLNYTYQNTEFCNSTCTSVHVEQYTYTAAH